MEGFCCMRQRHVARTEILERRMLLDAVLDAGILRVTGTAEAEAVAVAIRGSVPKVHVSIGDAAWRFNPAHVTSIQIDLKEGNDRFDVGKGIGGVYVLGGLGEDTIVGGAGNDTLVSGGGKDLVFGGLGDDRIDGGPTADRLFGEDGNDRIYGGEAGDHMEGGGAVDRLFGETGNDVLAGGSSNDKLYGNEGDDVLLGMGQNDLLNGGEDEDLLLGGDGFDTLHGADGDDTLDGEKRDDAVFGDNGFDSVSGGNGNDLVDGGDENDTLHGGDANDTLRGGAGNDRAFGENGLDTIDGGEDADSLSGGTAEDTLDGGGGDDALFGGPDEDTLSGNTGADRYYSYDDDTHGGLDDIDALLGFADGDAAWTEDEIWQLDRGFAMLQSRTNNTRLLKFTDGDTIVIRRVADLGEDTLAINTGTGRIDVADLAFNEPTLDPHVTLIHELAHNWDEPDENPSFGEFNEISHWRRPTGEWEHDPSVPFAREYGKTNPVEDFATSVEVYFAQSKPASEWQVKWDYVDRWLDSLSG
jgi:Ca2+-binding RTX toxin-like protein